MTPPTVTNDAAPEVRGLYKRWPAPLPILDDAGEIEKLARTLKVAPLVAQLLHQRGLTDADQARRFFDPKLTDLHDPRQLPGCERAADRLVNAVRSRESIVIYGDYDVDGVTATTILYHVLKTADPDANVRCYVPHRIDEGYGINAESLETLAEEGAALIVSVDCGITAVEPAKIAAELGLDLIITDHHEIGETLPDCYALVHPRLPGEDGKYYPFCELCGAGVAYKLAWQIARAWCGSDRVTTELRTALVNVLPFAALGTIADVVPLVDENRTIARYGLQRVKQTPNVGLNALIDASRLRDEKIDAYHVGFVLGPRLNACGRMGHAREAVRLLTDATPDEAAEIAEFLNAENDRRRATERKIVESAKEQVTTCGYDSNDVRAIVLADADWHQGVVGIVCSRLVETFGRPCVLMNITDGQAHGSARSIDGFNIYDAFCACREHLTTFGGHAMAAGLRLPTENLDAFRNALVAYTNEQLSVEDLTPVLRIDADTTVGDLTQGVVEQINRLAPFGRSNPTPIVRINNVQLDQSARVMGAGGKHINFTVREGRASLRCIGWSMGDLCPRLPAGVHVDLVGEPNLNHFNGRTSVQLTLKDLRIRG
ncbi:MAG: single-stranded-DNA-specific exonuclease RecJ [Phycisphaeraceae bacterium]